MSALSLWLEISAENKQVRSKGKLCSKLMPRCKNVPRALSICQQREREREAHCSLSLSLPHSTVCCILKIRACTGNSWRCLPPLHLRPSTHSQRQKIPEPETETETETAPSWSCRAAGTQLLLASFSVAFATASFLPTDKLPASKERQRERGKRDRGNSRQLHDEMPETASVNAVYVAFFLSCYMPRMIHLSTATATGCASATKRSPLACNSSSSSAA